jgi:integrase
METSVLIIPGEQVTNREDRLIVLNRHAGAVVQEIRRIHLESVITYNGRPIKKMYGASWRKARTKAGLPMVRVHDLEHTFGRRLRAAGVSFEDRQDLLGHTSGRIKTHYAKPEPENPIRTANAVCPDGHKMDTFVILKKITA